MKLSTILGRLDNLTKAGNGWRASCPGHPDSNPSFTMWIKEVDGKPKLCLHCFANSFCSIEDMCAGLDILPRDLYNIDVDVEGITPQPTGVSTELGPDELKYAESFVIKAAVSGGRESVEWLSDRCGLSAEDVWHWRIGGAGPSAVIPSFDIHGVIRGYRQRYRDSEVKELSPRRPENGRWLPYTYRETALQDRHPELVVTEGPIDALTLSAVGYDVFAVLGVSNTSRPELVRDLTKIAAGRPVVVVGDNDDAGRGFNKDIAALLGPVKVVVPPDDDVNAWFEADRNGFAAVFRAAVDRNEPEDLAGLLDDIVTFLRRFVFLTEPEWFEVLALWSVLTGLVRSKEAAHIAPRVCLLSGQPGSGKTTTMDVLAAITGGRLGAGMTPAAVLRTMYPPDGGPVPMMLDEIDNIYTSNADTGMLTTILNSGYKRGSVVTRANNDDQAGTIDYPCFGPVVFAGLAKAKIPEALMSRAFMIDLPRAKVSERPERYNAFIHGKEAEPISERITRWVETVTDDDVLKAMYAAFELFPDLANREMELWSAVGIVAVLAGGGWPDRIIAAHVAVGDLGKDREETAGVRLLRLIRELRDEPDRTRYGLVNDRGVSREAVARYVNAKDDTFARWGRGDGISGDQVRNILREHKVPAPTLINFGGRDRARGWRWSDFEDAWSRYVPHESNAGNTDETAGTGVR